MPEIAQKNNGGVSFSSMPVRILEDSKTCRSALAFDVQVREKEKMTCRRKSGRRGRVLQREGTEETGTRGTRWIEGKVGRETDKRIHGVK